MANKTSLTLPCNYSILPASGQGGKLSPQAALQSPLMGGAVMALLVP